MCRLVAGDASHVRPNCARHHYWIPGVAEAIASIPLGRGEAPGVAIQLLAPGGAIATNSIIPGPCVLEGYAYFSENLV